MSEDTKLSPISLDQALQVEDIVFKNVDVPEWGGQIRLGSLTAKDVSEWLEANADPQRQKVAGVRLLVKSIVDTDGSRVPLDKVETYAEALMKKSAVVINRLIMAVRELNGLTKEAADERKNEQSEAVTAGSPSASL